MRGHAYLTPEQIVQLTNAQVRHRSSVRQRQRLAEAVIEILFRNLNSAIQLQPAAMALLK